MFARLLRLLRHDWAMLQLEVECLRQGGHRQVSIRRHKLHRRTQHALQKTSWQSCISLRSWSSDRKLGDAHGMTVNFKRCVTLIILKSDSLGCLDAKINFKGWSCLGHKSNVNEQHRNGWRVRHAGKLQTFNWNRDGISRREKSNVSQSLKAGRHPKRPVWKLHVIQY